MDELIYSVRKVFRDYLPSQGCDFFNIPEYQRGYKWTADNVKQLLNDLKTLERVILMHFIAYRILLLQKVN